MIYLYGHLGVGLLILAVWYGRAWLAGKDEMEIFLDRIAAQNPKDKKLWYRTCADYLKPVLEAMVVVVLWPAGIFMIAQQLWVATRGGDTNFYDPDREFVVQHADLKERLSVAEIEASAYITDPLHAVPKLPFGHLYPAWKVLVDSMGPDDTVWSFSTLWPYCGRKQLREGYVVVRGDVVGTHFLTVLKIIDDS